MATSIEDTSAQYTIDYFIEKFDKIPAKNWIRGRFGFNGIHCALGHCGMTYTGGDNNESKALMGLIPDVAFINDDAIQYGTTPKERILNKLYEIKDSNIN